MISPEIDKRRETFFKLIFGKQTGYLCIAHRSKNQMFENFYHYPNELPEALSHINDFFLEYDVYFCSQLFGKKQRRKESVEDCPNLWSDLDTLPPDELLVEPSVLIESSPGRYQGLWVLDKSIAASEAEDYSRRIAYYHADHGADRSGWDLTQLLRIPYTQNHKYDPPPTVTIAEANTKKYRISDFEGYPQTEGFEHLEVPFPEKFENNSVDILALHKKEINPRFWTLFYEEPDEDWSKALWQLELILFESGLDREDIFVVARESACNKYRRDNRDERLLWREVCKAEAHTKSLTSELLGIADADIEMRKILTDAERGWIKKNPSLIEEYIEWASTLGDAAWQYHQVGAFVILSALLSGNVRLPTSYGIVIPNLWFMILADTTLTRKTTAMDIAMDLIIEIDSDAVLATDGSVEGLFSSLSARPGRPSIFLRDEFSGLLEQMTKKDYYAGMAETFTKLYDGKYQKRVLRREVIEVRDPVLILFAGGIKTRIMELLRYDHVASGFIPRFLFVSAESDITKLRPLGPPTERSIDTRNRLLEKFKELYRYYNRTQEIKVGDRVTISQVRFDASLTDDAWLRYNKFEADLVAQGLETDLKDLMTPTFDRMAKSGLKMATLLAATRTQSGDVIVQETDIVRAFFYIEQWGQHTIELIGNIGKSTAERQLERIYQSILRKPGIGRSILMQNHHLSSRDANLIFETLEQRGIVTHSKRGRASFYTATDIRIKL